MVIRPYEADRDRDAALRIWREIGWLTPGGEEGARCFIEASKAWVAEMRGEAECLVCTAPGAYRYLEEDLAVSYVTAVTTSRVARKQGCASRVTARAIAVDALEGALMSHLGMFEQGYYNQLGFGTLGFEHRVTFDPARLEISETARTPLRITAEEWTDVHAARLARFKRHGTPNLFPAAITRAEMLLTTNGFGLGYRDAPDGGLSHLIWCSTEAVENGPYRVEWMIYRDFREFRELIGLIKTLGDQIHAVSLDEPPEIQMQDFIRQPFKHFRISEKGKFEAGTQTAAYRQARICDLPACMARTHLRCGEARFNLRLHDPIERFLEESEWRGISGEYVIRAGKESVAEPGRDASLPTLEASVGAFTRLWLGVRPATGLAAADDLSGPESLLRELDWLFLLPPMRTDWDY